mmetsp:Transcript_53173/g.108474  ORF Transcript_53173/g.108474 Transcript_53173/m.108474 type:complete len:211 (+) Transcript_53173:567-1199(+)
MEYLEFLSSAKKRSEGMRLMGFLLEAKLRTAESPESSPSCSLSFIVCISTLTTSSGAMKGEGVGPATIFSFTSLAGLSFRLGSTAESNLLASKTACTRCASFCRRAYSSASSGVRADALCLVARALKSKPDRTARRENLDASESIDIIMGERLDDWRDKPEERKAPMRPGANAEGEKQAAPERAVRKMTVLIIVCLYRLLRTTRVGLLRA